MTALDPSGRAIDRQVLAEKTVRPGASVDDKLTLVPGNCQRLKKAGIAGRTGAVALDVLRAKVTSQSD